MSYTVSNTGVLSVAAGDGIAVDQATGDVTITGTAPQGPQGYQGSQGYQGTQGYQGAQGYQGSQGATPTTPQITRVQMPASGFAFSTTAAIVPLSAITFDTASAYNVSTYAYTCPRDTYYVVDAVVAASSAVTLTAFIYRNGTAQAMSGPSGPNTESAAVTSLHDVLSCLAGDTLALYAVASAGAQAKVAGNQNFLSVQAGL